MHFTGTMDHWDPAVTDGLARDREVILFNSAGISSTSVDVPTSIEEMAANSAAFIKALGLTEVDVLGFSLGGLVAQELAIAEPRLVRRLVLVGTGPRSSEGMASERKENVLCWTENPNCDLVFDPHFETTSFLSNAARTEF